MSTILTVTNISSTDVDQSGLNQVELYLAPTLGADTTGITDAISDAEAFALRAEAAALVAEGHSADTAADVVSTNADVVTTNNNAAATAQDAADAAQDAADTAADVVSTNADVVTTNANVVQTGTDAANTAADVEQTSLDVITTGQNVSATNANAAAAAVSETNAAQSALNAAQAFDNFDDKYLGSKTVAPTVDNDGDALVVGTTYWHDNGDGTGNLFYWNGAVWESPDKAASQSAAAAAASASAANTSAGDANVAKLAAEQAEADSQTAQAASEAAQAASEAAQAAAELSEDVALDAAERAEAANAGGGSPGSSGGRDYAGSGFSEWGNHGSTTTRIPVNQGMYTAPTSPTWSNLFRLGGRIDAVEGTSRTNNAIAIVDGVEHEITGTAYAGDQFDTNQVEFPTAPDGAKSLNPTTGEVHKYHDLAGVGEKQETYSVNFDRSTYIDLTAVPYNMAVGAKIEFKFKFNNLTGYQYIFDTNATNRAYMYKTLNTDNLLFGGIRNVTVNGEVISNNTFPVELNVEYHVVAETNVTTTIDRFGAKSAFGTLSDFLEGEIWDITLEDPALTAVGIPPRHYLNADWQSADDAAPDYAVVTDRNGFTDEDWGVGFVANNPDSRVTIPEWVASADSEVSFTVRMDAFSGTSYIFSNASDTQRIYITSAGVVGWDGFSTRPMLINGVEYANATYTYTLGETLNINGVPNDGLVITKFGDAEQSGGEFTGRIWDVRLTDNTNPANSRHYPLVINSATQPDTLVAEDTTYDKDTAPFYSPDYNNLQYVDIPLWEPANGQVSVKFKVDSVGASQYILEGRENDSTPTPCSFSITPDGSLSVRGFGNSSLTPSESVQAGVEYTWTATVPSGGAVRKIGTAWTGTAGIIGKIWDVELIDNTDPTNSRYYPSIDYRPDGSTSGTVLEETLKPELVTNGDFSSGTTDWLFSGDVSVVGNTAHFDGSTGTYIQQDGLGFATGDEFVIEFTVSDYVSGSLLVFLNDTNLAPISANGTYTLTGTADSDNDYISFWRDGGVIPFDFKVGNIKCYKVTDGTLVNFPTNQEWTLAQVDGASDGTLENFTAGSEWDNDLVTDGTIVGTTLRTPMTLQDAQKCFLEAKYTDFEPIISRKDLCFLETWKEEVVDFVCPFGNVQFGGTTHDGESLVNVTDFVAQGYSAFGEWDETTVGKVVNWNLLTPEEQNVWRNNPKNNLIFENGVQYQYRYRIRVVEGLGDDWACVRPTVAEKGTPTWFGYDQSGTTSNYIIQRGQRTDTRDYYKQNPEFGTIFGGTSRTAGFDTSDLTRFQNTEGTTVTAADGKISALPIALVQRLNQGGYHPTYNPQGTSQFWRTTTGSIAKWYHSALLGLINSESDCFHYNAGTIPTDIGYVASGPYGGRVGKPYSGRDDQYGYYDAIYAGQVEDLRLNANKQDYARLLTDSVRSDVAGETRGKGKVPFTKVFNGTYSRTSGTSIEINVTDINAEVAEMIRVYGSAALGTSLDGVLRGYLVNHEAGRESIHPVSRTGAIADNFMFGHALDSDTVIPTYNVGDNVSLILSTESILLSAEYDSLPWVDIIGDPVRIAATFPDGVVGQWINHIPDGTPNTVYYLNEKANSTTASATFTTDDGVSWTNSSSGITATTNSTYSTVFDPANVVVVYQYEALSDFTEPDSNRAVQGDLGDVEVTERSDVSYGNRLAPSLLDVVLKDAATVADPSSEVKSLTGYGFQSNGELADSAATGSITHTPVTLGAPANDSNAVKTLPHLVEKDGLLYVQHHATQLVYDDGSFVPWGDNDQITIRDDEGTITDLNGNVVKVVTHTHMIPLGIAHKNETK